MRRNYGSLNLAALDLHNAAANGAVDGLEREFSSLDPCAYECDSVDSSCSSDEFARCIGFPLERLTLAPSTSEATAKDAPSSSSVVMTAPVAINPQHPVAMDEAQDTVARESARRKRSISARGLDDDGDVRISNKLVATSEWPRQMHDQHHVELSALRCLSLKVMLSSLSTATSSSSSDDSPSSLSSSSGSYTGYVGIGSREKAAAIMPLRRPSIPCNMIQSV